MNPMEKHLTIVGALRIGFGILGLAIGCFVFFLLTGIGIASQEEEAMVILSTIGTGVGGFLFLISAPGIVGGIGLLRRAEWARVLVLILSAIDLLNVPVGTALGAYSIWVLVQEDTVRLIKGLPPVERPPTPAVSGGEGAAG